MDMIEQIEIKDAWAANRQFHDHLQEIIRKIVPVTCVDQIKEREVSYIYLTNWNVIDRNDGCEVMISALCKIGLYSSKDDDDDDYAGRREINPYVTFPERYLWTDDWKDELINTDLAHKLHMARYHLEQATVARDNITNNQLPTAEKLIFDKTVAVGKIVQAMLIRGLEIPKERT